MKVVSLVPSITATLCRLGLKDSLVGITNFCVEPPDLHRFAKRVGGTKDPDLDLIKSLNPDLVFVNTEENRSVDIEKLRSMASINESYPKSPFDVPDMIRGFGRSLKDRGGSFEKTAKEIENSLDHPPFQKMPGTFLYFIWRDPYMVVGSNTYISNVLSFFGFKNVMGDEVAYPSLTPETINELDADYIFLSTEPYPFRNRDFLQLQRETSVKGKAYKVDGKLLSWHGIHLLDAIKEFDCHGVGLESKLFRPF